MSEFQISRAKFIRKRFCVIFIFSIIASFMPLLHLGFIMGFCSMIIFSLFLAIHDSEYRNYADFPISLFNVKTGKILFLEVLIGAICTSILWNIFSPAIN